MGGKRHFAFGGLADRRGLRLLLRERLRLADSGDRFLPGLLDRDRRDNDLRLGLSERLVGDNRRLSRERERGR